MNVVRRSIPGMSSTFTGAKKVTLRPEYEAYGPTTTVGGYQHALAHARDAGMPEDYEDYLHQRVPSPDSLMDARPDTNIDEFGLMSPWYL